MKTATLSRRVDKLAGASHEKPYYLIMHDTDTSIVWRYSDTRQAEELFGKKKKRILKKIERGKLRKRSDVVFISAVGDPNQTAPLMNLPVGIPTDIDDITAN